MDTVTPEKRRLIMAKVRSKDTTPELVVRKLSHSLGYRFRLYRRDLPGNPDLVFLGLKKIIFVHGCFWHQHRCRRGNRIPASHREYWTNKLEANVVRDKRNLRKLRRLGWKVLVVWECQTRDLSKLTEKLDAFLSG